MSIGEALLAHLLCLGDLDRDDQQAVLALPGQIEKLPRHKDILREGDIPDTSVIVLEGFLARYSIVADGARQIHSFYIPTDAPCLETLHIDYMDNNLGAVVDSRIGLVPHDAIYAMMDDRPKVRALMWRETLVQAAIFREWLTRNSRLPAPAAMAHLFCEMFVRSRAVELNDGDDCALPVTQELLAEALGLTSVHINRTLQQLREGGLVDHRNGVLTVKDFDRLSKLAEFDPRYLHLHC